MPTEQGIAWVRVGRAAGICWQPPGCDHPVAFFTIDNPGKYATDQKTRREIAIWNTVVNQAAGSLNAGDDPYAHLTPEQKNVLSIWLPEQCAKYGCTPGAAAGGGGGALIPGTGSGGLIDTTAGSTSMGFLDRSIVGPVKVWHVAVIGLVGLALAARRRSGGSGNA